MIYTTLDNTQTFNINPLSNSELIMALVGQRLVKPQVPRYYHERNDVWIDNPDHPRYKEAMEFYQIDKAVTIAKLAILLVFTLDQEIVNEERKKLKYRIGMHLDDDIWVDYIQNHVSNQDIVNVINTTLLTENRVYDIFNVLVRYIYRGGTEIIDARLKNAINSQIHMDTINVMGLDLVNPLDEYIACTAANINWIEWEKFENDKKAELISLYRINKIVESHSQDEVQIEMERQSKK